jgi:hypothetical protein
MFAKNSIANPMGHKLHGVVHNAGQKLRARRRQDPFIVTYIDRVPIRKRLRWQQQSACADKHLVMMVCKLQPSETSDERVIRCRTAGGLAATLHVKTSALSYLLLLSPSCLCPLSPAHRTKRAPLTPVCAENQPCKSCASAWSSIAYTLST